MPTRAPNPAAMGGRPPSPKSMEEASSQLVQEQMFGGGPEPELPVSRKRVIIKAPYPKIYADHPEIIGGGVEFFGSVPKRSSTFAWSELCVTPDPDCDLAPSPEVQKQWYNTYLYVPEQQSHSERQFLERFVEGPNGEWMDVVKAQRMLRYYDERREREMKEQMQRKMLLSGAAMRNSGYMDAYSGEPLVECNGELATKETIIEEHGIQRSATELAKQAARDARDGSDWDNLRMPWPFGDPYRNKVLSQHTYEWFDRNHNPYVPTDRSVDMIELPTMYMDSVEYEQFLAAEMPMHMPMNVPQHAPKQVHI